MSDPTNPFQNRNELKDHFKKDETFAFVALKDEIERLRAELAAANARVETLAKEVAELRSRPDALRADKAEAELAAARGTLVAVRKYLPQPSNRMRTELHGIIEEIDAQLKGGGDE